MFTGFGVIQPQTRKLKLKIMKIGSFTWIKSMKTGDSFYSDSAANKFTYVAKHGIKISTERLICINQTTLKTYRITKVTRLN